MIALIPYKNNGSPMRVTFIRANDFSNPMRVLVQAHGVAGLDYVKHVTLCSEGAADKSQDVIFCFKSKDEAVAIYQDCTEQEASDRVAAYMQGRFINYIELNDYNGYDWQDPARNHGINPENHSGGVIISNGLGISITYHECSDKVSPPLVLFKGLGLNAAKQEVANHLARTRERDEQKKRLQEMEFPVPDNPDRFFYEGAEFIRVNYKLPDHGAVREQDLVPYLDAYNIPHKVRYFFGGDVSAEGCVLCALIDNKRLIVLFNSDTTEAMKVYLSTHAAYKEKLNITGSQDNPNEVESRLRFTTLAGQVIAENEANLALFRAAQAGDGASVRELLNNGAKVNCYDHKGNNAIHIALKNNHTDIASYLFNQKHIDIDQKNKKGQTYLMLAAVNGDIKILRELYHLDADIAAEDNQGRTALGYAIRSSKVRAFDFLLRCDASVITHADKRSYTPIDYAADLCAKGSLDGKKILVTLMTEDAPLKNGSTNFYLQMKLYCFLTKVILNEKFDGKTSSDAANELLNLEHEGLGQCSRLTQFWLKCMWEQFNSSKSNSFSNILDFFVKWDGVSPVSDRDQQLVIPFVKWMVASKSSGNESHLENVPSECNIVVPVTGSLAELLPKIVKENTLVYVSYLAESIEGKNRQLFGHAVGLCRFKGNYYFYDTNQYGANYVMRADAESTASILLREVPIFNNEAPALQFHVYGFGQPLDDKSKIELLDLSLKAAERPINLFILLMESMSNKDAISTEYFTAQLKSSDVSLADISMMRKLILSLSYFFQQDTFEVLIQKGLDPNCMMENKRTLFHLVAMHGNVDAVNALLSDTVLNKQDSHGQTPLFLALSEKHYDVANVLLDAGADCNIATANGRTPLLAACQRGHLEPPPN